MKKQTKYTMTWRNKWITSECKTIEGMIKVYSETAKYFEEMKKNGIKLEKNSGIDDDYAELFTYDEKIAKKFGFEEEQDEDDKEED
jgi:hypothetical protein